MLLLRNLSPPQCWSRGREKDAAQPLHGLQLPVSRLTPPPSDLGSRWIIGPGFSWTQLICSHPPPQPALPRQLLIPTSHLFSHSWGQGPQGQGGTSLKGRPAQGLSPGDIGNTGQLSFRENSRHFLRKLHMETRAEDEWRLQRQKLGCLLPPSARTRPTRALWTNSGP